MKKAVLMVDDSSSGPVVWRLRTINSNATSSGWEEEFIYQENCLLLTQKYYKLLYLY